MKKISAYGRIENGGFRDEPVYMIGITIGGGSRPWINPVGQ